MSKFQPLQHYLIWTTDCQVMFYKLLMVHYLYFFGLHFMPIGSMVLRVENDGSGSDGGIGVGEWQRGGQGNLLNPPNSPPL